jgi:hypothetical protein
MRGDQLIRRWREIRKIEAIPCWLTAAEISKQEEIRILNIYPEVQALQAAGFLLYIERVDRANPWAFIDTFKSRIQPLFVFNRYTCLLVGFPYFFQNIRTFLVNFPVPASKNSIKLFSGVSYTEFLVRRTPGPGLK